jgi:coenzyme F420-0:L-glutamate ligase/coenzyme F420-1:gamma-L-glutamate ligase
VTAFEVAAVTGIGEVTAGTDLAGLLAGVLRGTLRDGDILVVTSKVVSKAEGRLVRGDRAAALAAETDRVVARRGGTTIVRTRHGLVMAAAGVDSSNTAPGTVVLLPLDPDRSARRLRVRLREIVGVNVGVVVSDTSGRAWRTGQTDIAVGAAGVTVLDDHAGRSDPYGNPLVVTAPAVADELAAAGDLAKGKVAMAPVALVRGLSDRVLPEGDHGDGARVLVRPEVADMFGLGTREAVLQALGDGPAVGRGFGAPAPVEELVAALESVLGGAAAIGRLPGPAVTVDPLDPDPRAQGRTEARAEAVARAHGWLPGTGGPTVLRPALP